MKKIILIVFFITTLTVLFAAPEQKARLDVYGANVILTPVSGPEKGYFKNINWGDNEKREFCLSGETAPLPAGKWIKSDFSFMPDSDGRVEISLMSNYFVNPGSTALSPCWVYYDMISATGTTLKNGDFEEFKDGIPMFWTCKASQYITDGIDFISGKAAIKAWHNERCKQVLAVKKGQLVTITVHAQAGPVEMTPVDSKNISMAKSNPVKSDWVPFALDWTNSTPPVWDFSPYIDAPAGKYGFLKTTGPHFFLGDSGKQIRLWGVNISGPSCFPSHEESEKIAVFLRRWGINAVRMSHLDAVWANGLINYGNKKQMAFNEDKFDRFFYFIAELKKNGIYYVLDGKHNFEFRTDEFKDFNSWSGVSLPLAFSSAMQQHFEKYLRELFTRTNPYTKVALADDPALAGVQLLNETFLARNMNKIKTNSDLPASLRQGFLAKWRVWADEQKISGEYDDVSIPAIRRRFFSWLERSEFQRLYSFCRNELKLKCPIATTSCYVGAFSLPSAADGDYTEGHAYYGHPKNETVEFEGKKQSLISLENSGAYVGNNYMKWLPFLLQQRIAYQPFVVGEWNSCIPERFDAPLQMAAFGDIQDFDGMFLFNLAQGDWSKISTRNIGPFTSMENPAIMINMIPAALAWHGRMIPSASEALAITASDAVVFGDVDSKSKKDINKNDFGQVVDAAQQVLETVSEPYSYNAFAENLFLFRVYNCPEVAGIKTPPSLVKRISCFQNCAKIFPTQSEAAKRLSPMVLGQNMVTVNTRQWVGVWGTLGGKNIMVGPLTVAAEPDQDFSVTVVSLDGKSLADASKILVAIGPVSMARNTILLEKTDIKTGCRLARWQMNKTENEPMAKPIRAKLRISGFKGQCFRVSSIGNKENRVAVAESNDIAWELDPISPSWFYLLERS